MTVSASWIHGNALTIESPLHLDMDGKENGRLVLTPRGWGAEVSNEGHSVASWMHLPIPAPIEGVGALARFELLRVFLLFQYSDAVVQNVHLYDGVDKIQEFTRPGDPGVFLRKGPANTFELATPHWVKSGVGLSFEFKALTFTGGDRQHGGAQTHPTLHVAAAGAEFRSTSVVSSVLGVVREFTNFIRRGP